MLRNDQIVHFVFGKNALVRFYFRESGHERVDSIKKKMSPV